MRITFPIFLFFLLSKLHAQQLIFENISDKIGLPSKECYNVMQDSKGYIWISTDAGLCKYNGNTLEIFDKDNGIDENSCYSVVEDHYGNIWIGTSACRILCYRNNRIHESINWKSISKNLPEYQFIYSIKPLDKNTIYASTQSYSFKADLKTGEIQSFNTNDSTVDFFLTSSGDQMLCNKTGIRDPGLFTKNTKKGFLLFKINNNGNLFNIKISVSNYLAPDWRLLTAASRKGEFFISYYNTLLKINKDNSYKVITTQNKIVGLYVDRTDGLWVCTYKTGAYYYPNSNTSVDPLRILSDYSVSGVCEDQEGGIWCTTLEKGIFYSRSKYVLTYKNVVGLDRRAEMIKNIDTSLYISSIPEKVFIMHKTGLIERNFGLAPNYIVKDISKIGEKLYVSGREFIKSYDESGNSNYLKNKHFFQAGALQIIEGPEKKIFTISATHDLQDITDEIVSAKIHKITGLGRYLFYSTRLDRFFWGAKEGVYYVKEDYQTFTKINGVYGSVTKIVEIKNGPICFLTRESGIYLMDGDEVMRVDEKLGLPASVFYDIVEDENGSIWIGSNRGLIRVNNSPSTSIKVYNVFNGLPSNIIYNLAIYDSYLYLSTEEGISRFPINIDLTNNITAHMSLNSMKINDGIAVYHEGMSLAHDKNSIHFTFNIPTFKQMGNTRFIYSLKSNEEKTELIEGNKLALSNLLPGQYILTVFAVNNDGVKSRIPLVLHFEIEKPFWSRGWFIFLTFIGIVGFIYTIIRAISRDIKIKEKKKTELNQQLSEFRLNAIQAQMNPHFIFNSLNSIQHYILSNQTQYAYDYLARFSTLIRQVMINSENSTISLEKEIEMLEIYIELEQRRFQNRFSYEIIYHDNLSLNQIEIPVMLIQPFVENAIWHGIMNLKKHETGKLLVEFVLENEFLKISVEDNGIGRKAAGKLKKPGGYDSVGMLFSEKRLEMMKLINGKTSRIIVTDLYRDDETASGTRVEIFLSL